jgi:hypothetical protein
MIKIDFEFDTKYGLFRDALYLPEDHAFTDVEIEAMKQGRVDNWLSIISLASSQESIPEEIPPEVL